jgi:hypothetical protein
MSATIHYLRPFQREDLAEPAEAERTAPDRATPESETEEAGAQTKSGKRRSGRAMPCGRSSKWKKKIGGGVVARDKRS